MLQIAQNQYGNPTQSAKIALSCLAVLTIVAFLPAIANAQSYLTQVGVPAFTTELPVEQGFLNVGTVVSLTSRSEFERFERGR